MQRLIEEITFDKVSFDNGYWTRIIERMYNEDDVESLEVRIRESARDKMRNQIEKQLCTNTNQTNVVSSNYGKALNKRMTREEQMGLLSQLSDNNNVKVYFSDFQHNVLDFQMKEHEKFLRPFLQIFRSVD